MNANRQLLKGADESSGTSQSDGHSLRWGILAACVIAGIALYYVGENWRGKREWERYERQLSEQGHALKWEAYIPPPVADEQNFFAAPNMAAWLVGRGGNALSLKLNSGRKAFLEQRNTNCLLKVSFVSPDAPIAPREADLILNYQDKVLSLGSASPERFAAPVIIPRIVIDNAPLSLVISNLARQVNLQCTIDPHLGLNSGGNDLLVSLSWQEQTALGALLQLLENYNLSLELDPGMRTGRVIKRTGRACATSDAQNELAKLIQKTMDSLTNGVDEPSALAVDSFTTFVRSTPRARPGRVFIRSEQVPPAAEVGKLFSRRVPEYFRSPEQMEAEAEGTNCFGIQLSPARYTLAADYLDWSDQLEPAFQSIREALQRPFARLPGDYRDPTQIPFPNFVVMRTLVQTLAQRAQCHLLLDQPDEALKDLELMHGVCRVLEGPPGGKPETLVAAMIDVAVRGLYVGTVEEGLRLDAWQEPQLAVIQTRLSEIHLLPIVAESFATERASVCRVLEKASYEQFDGILGKSSPTTVWDRVKDPRYTFLALAPRGWFDQNRRTVALREQSAIEAFDLRRGVILTEKANVFTEDQQSHHGFSPYDFLADLVPTASRVIQTTARNQVLVNEAVVICALERYRLAKGRYPDAAEELKPTFLRSIPADIFGGSALKVRLAPDKQPVVYSIGWNEKDDGGVPGNKEPHDFALQDGDWVWPFKGNLIK